MGATTNSLKLRPRVTEVSVTGLLKETEDPSEVGFHYVYASAGNGLRGEFRLKEGEDLDQWCDDTGWEWLPGMRTSLRQQTAQEKQIPPEIEDAPPWDHLRDSAIEAVQHANHPPVLFRRGGYPTEVHVNEKGVPTTRLVDSVRMRDRLGEVARWWRMGRTGPYAVKPPADIAAALLVTPGLHLPALDAVTEFPVLSKDGHIITRRGYDAGSATYFAPSIPLARLELGAHPRLALSWLGEMLQDFEFRSKADKANVLGLMLTPILRPIIDGPVPLAGIRAVKAGSGKSLLAKAALMVLTGRIPEATGLGDDEDEAEKRLTALFLAGAQFVFLDNIRTGSTLKSAALARALQTPTWAARIIQTSKYPTLPVRCTWIATGNNLAASDEIARRSYLIELAPEVERPDLRDPSRFLHANLLRWVDENRPALLSAVLCLVQYWVEEGMPLYEEVPVLSTFEDWSRIVGSVLWCAGVRDFLGNEERKRDIVEDPVNLEREVLLMRISELEMGTREEGFTIRELQLATKFNDGMMSAVQPFLASKTEWASEEAVTQLGYAVRTFTEGIYGGLRLVKVGKAPRRGGAVYRVERTETSM